MKKFLCCYAKFKCGIIAEDNFIEIIDRFKSEFGLYYDICDINNVNGCDARIYLVDEAFENDLKSEEVRIHSSHSRNKKYLLTGKIYTQDDANIFAYHKQENQKVYYQIVNTNIKIFADTEQKNVYMSGDNIYDIFSYVFETLLSINIEYNGGIQFHAACCEFNGNGYIITGKSGSGKTSLLFDILKNGGYFHSNDRVAVFKEGEKYVAYSIPIPVNVPIKMMNTMEEWKSNDVVCNAKPGTKIRFLVNELPILLGEKIVKKIDIQNIISVDYSDDEPSFKILDNGNINDYIELLTPFDENHPKWLKLFDYPDEDDAKAAVSEMNNNIKILYVSGNDTFKALNNYINSINAFK